MQGAPSSQAKPTRAARGQSGSRRGRARLRTGRFWQLLSVMTGTIWRWGVGTGGCMSGTPAAMSTFRCAFTFLHPALEGSLSTCRK